MEYDMIYREVLGRLDAFKQNDQIIKTTDINRKALNNMLYKYEVNKDTEELSKPFKDCIETMKEAGLSIKDILEILTVSSKEMQPFVTNAKKELKTLQETNEELYQEIGSVMLEDEKMTERSMHFPHIGTVKVERDKVVTVKDEDKVIQELSKNKERREKYLKLSKTITKLQEAKDGKIDGITVEDKYKVTVKADK